MFSFSSVPNNIPFPPLSTGLYGPSGILDGTVGNVYKVFIAGSNEINEWIKIDFGKVISQIGHVKVIDRHGIEQADSLIVVVVEEEE